MSKKLKAIIYKYYKFERIENEHKPGETKVYTCLHCGEEKRAKTTSNLITHLETAEDHQNILNKYNEEVKNDKENMSPINSPMRANKRFRIDSPQTNTITSCFFKATKYEMSSQIQKDRTNYLLAMLIKCMLPLSLVENEYFTTYVSLIDSQFNMPTVKTMNKSNYKV